jgi:hypothetical protein
MGNSGQKTDTSLILQRTRSVRRDHERRRFQHERAEVPQESRITAQREIENTVREALSKGSLTGKEKLPAKVTLTLGQTSLNLVVDGIDPQADLAAIVVRIGQAWRRPQAP